MERSLRDELDANAARARAAEMEAAAVRDALRQALVATVERAVPLVVVADGWELRFRFREGIIKASPIRRADGTYNHQPPAWLRRLFGAERLQSADCCIKGAQRPALFEAARNAACAAYEREVLRRGERLFEHPWASGADVSYAWGEGPLGYVRMPLDALRARAGAGEWPSG
jgi:hypothetical protein